MCVPSCRQATVSRAPDIRNVTCHAIVLLRWIPLAGSILPEPECNITGVWEDFYLSAWETAQGLDASFILRCSPQGHRRLSCNGPAHLQDISIQHDGLDLRLAGRYTDVHYLLPSSTTTYTPLFLTSQLGATLVPSWGRSFSTSTQSVTALPITELDRHEAAKE